MKLPYSVILVFKRTFFPYDQAPKTQAKDTLSGAQLEKESFQHYRKSLTNGGILRDALSVHGTVNS